MKYILNKTPIKTTNKDAVNEAKTVSPKPFEGDVEYEMTKEMAKQILATRKGTEQNMPP